MGRGWGWIKGRRDRSDLGCDQSNPRYDCSNPGYDCLNPRCDRLNPGCDVLNPGCDSIERGDDVLARGFAGRTNRKITNDTAGLPAPSTKKNVRRRQIALARGLNTAAFSPADLKK